MAAEQKWNGIRQEWTLLCIAGIFAASGMAGYAQGIVPSVLPAPPLVPPSPISPPSPPAPPPPRVYPNREGHLFVYSTGGAEISQYEVGPDGRLSPLDPSSVSTTGDSPGAFTDPTGHFLYSMDWAHGSVFRYGTHPDGSLAEKSTLALHIDGAPIAITFDPAGRHAYVVDDNILYRGPNGVTATYNGGQGISRIYQCRLDPDGTLTPLTPAVVETEGTRPRGLCFTPNGRFAYAAESSGITQYSAGLDGTLHALKPAEVSTRDYYGMLTVDPQGRFLYGIGERTPDTLSRFRIEADGRLTPLPPLPLALDGQPFSGRPAGLVFEPTGKFAYLLPQTFGSQSPAGPPSGILQFQLEADGGLTPLSPPRVPTLDFAGAVGVDPNGCFLYVSGSGVTAQYQIRPDGTLLPLTPRVVSGGGLSGVSVVRRTAVFVPPAGIISDAARRRHPVSIAPGFDSSETVRRDDPRREERLRFQETPPVFAPDGKTAYLAHGDGNFVGRFGVGGDGTLTALPPAAAPGSSYPGTLALDPTGRFAYVVHGTDDEVAQYRVQPDGTFAALTPPAVELSGDRLVAHPSGHFLYAQSGIGDVSLMRIGPDGGLLPAAPASGSMSRSGGLAAPDVYGILPRQTTNLCWGLTLAPSGRSAYLISPKGDIQQYGVDADGGLRPLSPASVAAGLDPQAPSFDPTSRFAYVPDALAGTVRQYRVGKTGALLPLTPPALAAGIFPVSVSVSPSGRFAFVVDGGDRAVLYRDYATDKIRFRLITAQTPVLRCFRVRANGSLSPEVGAAVPTDQTGPLTFGPVGGTAYQADGERLRTYRLKPSGSLEVVSGK